MTDREKCIKGLECCSDMTVKRRHKCLKECPYDFVHNENCMGDMARDALELLKNEPLPVLNVKKNGIYFGDCPHCGEMITKKKTSYCPYCGKGVVWDV